MNNAELAFKRFRSNAYRSNVLRYVDVMDTEPSLHPPPEWVAALDQADADVAAGRVVDGEAIHLELRVSMERLARGDIVQSDEAISPL